MSLPISFTWTRANDADGDTVTYRHCVWLALDRPNNNACDATAIQTIAWAPGLICALIVLLIGALVLVLLIYLGMKQRRALLRAVVIATVILAILAFYLCGIAGAKTASKTVAQLEPGKAYLWKVIAEDGKGGSTQSETRRFTTR